MWHMYLLSRDAEVAGKIWYTYNNSDTIKGQVEDKL